MPSGDLERWYRCSAREILARAVTIQARREVSEWHLGAAATATFWEPAATAWRAAATALPTPGGRDPDQLLKVKPANAIARAHDPASGRAFESAERGGGQPAAQRDPAQRKPYQT